MAFKDSFAVVFDGIKKTFSFGIFSIPSLFIIFIFILFAFILKLLYYLFSTISFGFVLYFLWSLFIIAAIIYFIILLMINKEAYDFFNNKDVLSSSEINFGKRFKLSKKYFKGTIHHREFSEFLLFSLYFGIIVLGGLFWTIKNISKIHKESKKNKKEGLKNLYIWRKVYDKEKKDYVYYPRVIGLEK